MRKLIEIQSIVWAEVVKKTELATLIAQVRTDQIIYIYQDICFSISVRACFAAKIGHVSV